MFSAMESRIHVSFTHVTSSRSINSPITIFARECVVVTFPLHNRTSSCKSEQRGVVDLAT